MYHFSPKALFHPGGHITLSKSSMCYIIVACWLFLLNVAVCTWPSVQFSSVQSLSPVRLLVIPWTAAARPPCPLPTPGDYANSCPSRRWCHPTISSSLVPFSSHLQTFSASMCFPMSWFFTSGGQSIGVSASASVLPVNIQDWSPLGWTGWISLLSLQ